MQRTAARSTAVGTYFRSCTSPQNLRISRRKMACCFCSTRRVEYEAGGEDSDSAAWFLREQGGPKEADCFYAHPTTVANVFGWNSGQQGYAQGKGAKLTGFAAGTPDLMETQAGAVRDEGPRPRRRNWQPPPCGRHVLVPQHPRQRAEADRGVASSRPR